MDCTLASSDGVIRCTACGRVSDRLDRRQMCGQRPCDPPPPKCDCGAELKRRKSLAGDGLWWWWCPKEDRFVRVCKACNQR